MNATVTLLEEAERRLAARDYQGAQRFAMQVIARNQGDARAWFVMGVIAADHDVPARAAELFARAAGLDPGAARHHAHLARARLALSDREGALDAVNLALAAGPADALTHNTVGAVLTRLGDHLRAIGSLEAAAAIAPGNADYWYNLGASRQFLGRFPEAADAYRRALALRPDLPRAWSALVGLEKQTPGGQALAALTRLLEAARDADARLHYGHAIAKTLEDLGHWDASLEALVTAKAAKRREIAHDPAVPEALFAAAMATSGHDLGAGNPSGRPIFVVGLPRTGTTLVDRILSSHPDVASVGELTAFSLTVKRAAATPGPLVLDPPTLAAADGLDGAAIGAAYLDAAAPLAGAAPRFVDKMPLNAFYAALILKAFPNARVVRLRRHPLDAALSNYRQLFATQFSYYDYAFSLEHTARYVAGFERMAAHWGATLPPDRYLEIAYEDIVLDQEAATRRLLAFCGLPWNEACLAFHENAAPVATASAVQVRSPLYATSLARWRRYGRGLEPVLRVFRDAGLPTD